jgi:lipopolysaccharide export system protein LptA
LLQSEPVNSPARSITFDDTRSRAVYQGDVIYRDARQTMAAALLEVEIEDGRVRSVVATGSIEIRSFETGQKLTGSKVVHDVSSGDFYLTGEPAQAIDELGNMLSGRSLTFNQASGRVSVADETETVYHPEEEP